MNVCHPAQDIPAPTGHAPTPEKPFIAILALLACQVNTSSATPGIYWTYFPSPTPFLGVTWAKSPMQIHTPRPHPLGGWYTSYFYDNYPINLNFTFWGRTDGLSLSFNFPYNKNLIMPLKEKYIGASKKAVKTELPQSYLTKFKTTSLGPSSSISWNS